ncbi:MAG: UvrD-helicase domain-containing protein [Candidatus Wallbacteria bacterium]|nr:UvrD-helicase domain-containing protein [Candidatus Wallbacteria bacterium]
MCELKFPLILRVNASAGSGKTNLLAAWFIKLLFEKGVKLENILAITFTNAATAEMKTRILSTLKSLAFPGSGKALNTDSVEGLIPEKPEQKEIIRQIDYLISHYSDFNVRTIDSFINTLVTVSALELRSSPRQEIRLDVNFYLEYCLQQFLRKYGKVAEPEITGLINDLLELMFTYDRSDTWSVHDRIMEKVIELRTRELSSADGFQAELRDDYYELLIRFLKTASELLALIDESGQSDSFIQYFLKFLEKSREFTMPPDSKQWPLEPVEAWLKKNRNFDFKGLEVRLCEDYGRFVAASLGKDTYHHLKIHQEIKSILTDVENRGNLLFIDELNMRIHSLIGDSGGMPACLFFAGADFTHFLIDEFQDTSRLQLSNLFPLVENALSGEHASGSSFFLVGDMKQAIYRFSGGSSRLFLEIPDLFPAVEQKVDFYLETNFRSAPEIVKFVNHTFSTVNLSAWILRQADAKSFFDQAFADSIAEIYSSPAQKIPESTSGGYVSLTCHENAEGIQEEKLKEIFAGLAARFPDGNAEIAVLVRKRDEEEKIASLLLSMALPFTVISEKSLDVRENQEIAEITALLRFLNSPLDNLSFFTAVSGNLFRALTGLSGKELLSWQLNCRRQVPLYISFREKYPTFWENHFSPFFKRVGFLPPYDLVREIMENWQCFSLHRDLSGIFHHFLELVSSREERGENSLEALLEFIASGDDDSFYLKLSGSLAGIRIMTMHRSKGLSFDITVLPGQCIKKRSSRKNEFFVPAMDGSVTMVKMTAGLAGNLASCTEPLVAAAVDAYKNEQLNSFVDELNLNYVSFTRARQEIHVLIPETDDNLLPDLLFTGDARNLQYGSLLKTSTESPVEPEVSKELPRPQTHWYDKLVREKITLQSLESSESADFGDAVHSILSEIIYADPEKNREVLLDKIRSSRAVRQNLIPAEIAISTIIPTIEKLNSFFSPDSGEIFTELEFMTAEGERLVADRVILREGKLTVLDYKTGARTESHHEQVRKYLKHLGGIFKATSAEGYIFYLKEQNLEKCI